MENEIKKILISENDIQNRVKKLADEINRDYKDKDLLLVCILKGSIMFMGDLMKYINIYAKVEFMSVSSYGN